MEDRGGSRAGGRAGPRADVEHSQHEEGPCSKPPPLGYVESGGGRRVRRRRFASAERPAVRCRPMCLLVVISGVVPGIPLIVAANRDERRARPAIPMTRLDAAGGLAIRGGRDEVGGGTWLATNEVGVVAGLTNRPLRDGPDAAKRSRGELPLALAGHPTAAAAVEAFGTAIDPGAYNPSWLLVADRHDAFFVDVTATDEVVIEHLQPGVHVLENRNLHEPSPKADRVRELLGPALDGPAAQDCSSSCRRCSPTTRSHRASRRPTPATLASRSPREPSASTPTRTTTAPVRPRSSPSTSGPPRRPSAGPARHRATDDGSGRTPSGRAPPSYGRRATATFINSPRGHHADRDRAP